MKLFTEYPEKDELQYYQLLAEKAKFQMEKLYGNQENARRDTHAKTHACVKATLEIFDFDEEKIHSELAKKNSINCRTTQRNFSQKRTLRHTQKISSLAQIC